MEIMKICVRNMLEIIMLEILCIIYNIEIFNVHGDVLEQKKD